MKITILGCGTSGGVPLIGGNWGLCNPNNPRNRRRRVSILVEQADTVLLVDTSPDMREQLLDCGLQKLDAVLYTHSHADHCHGIDELRSLNWLMHKPIDIFADPETLGILKRRFDYIFAGSKHGGYYKPAVNPHEINGQGMTIGAIDVRHFWQKHGNMFSLGFRFGNFAYSTDASELDDAAFAALAGVKIWLVDCVRREPHHTHAHLARTLEWIERVRPQQAYLTHMNHTMDYDTLCKELPAGVLPAHDGLVIEC